MSDRRKLLEHVGNVERTMRYALQDLDEETLEKFLSHVFTSLAEIQADQLAEAWRRGA